MNQELVAAQPCSPFSVVRDVVDDITFGDDAVFKLDGFCLFRVFIYPKPVRTPYEESLSYFSDTVDKGDLGGIPVHKSVVPVLQGKVPFGYRT